MRQERKKAWERTQRVLGGVRVVIVDGLGRSHPGRATPRALIEYCDSKFGPGGCLPEQWPICRRFSCQPGKDCEVRFTRGGRGPAKIDFRNHLRAVTDPGVSFD